MCWVSEKQDIKIAEQDIPIFKIMTRVSNSNCVRSYFQDCLYLLNVLEKSDIIVQSNINNIIIVSKALHSYSEKMITFNDKGILFVYDKKGNFIRSYRDSSIVKGIIPKGSQYMVNKNEEFVSNQLILTKICAGLENTI